MRYLVSTDYGDVIVDINPECTNALETDLLSFQKPTAEILTELNLEVPLRAFGAKMVEIIDMVGTGSFSASPTMLNMMKQEKATTELNRIERWAKNTYSGENA